MRNASRTPNQKEERKCGISYKKKCRVGTVYEDENPILKTLPIKLIGSPIN